VRIGLVQMRCDKAAIAENLATMGRYLDHASELGIDIIGFPEMCLTGYADQPGIRNQSFPWVGPKWANFSN